MRRLITAARRDVPSFAAALVSVAAALYVIAYPFTLTAHPPITDLPFHAAQISIFRHYSDPAYHFREQMTLHPFEVPYVTMYGIGVAAAYVVSIATATKLAAIAMLALLPIGLAVLFWGMKKSPLWGVVGLGFVWTDLTHWGFLSFVGALGLYAASIGLALATLDRPTRARRIALGLVLGAVFFTHVYRFPFAIAAVLMAALFARSSSKSARPIVVPVVASSVVFGAWLVTKPKSLAADLGGMGFFFNRIRRIPDLLFSSYVGETGREEHRIAWLMLLALVAVTVLAIVYRERPLGERARISIVFPVTLAAGHFVAFLTLPVRMGEWWYVYPRELVAALLLLVAAIPDLPRARWIRLGSIGLTALACVRMAGLVAREWRQFEPLDADFRAIAAEIPRTPKLSYLIVDHRDTDKRHSPFVHLPAWVQADKGGWLSFHFAGWGIFPVRYRADASEVPPSVPRDWEWHPEQFDVREHGRFFDWFLIRIESDPSEIYAPDPELHFVASRGKWWLYRRHRGQ